MTTKPNVALVAGVGEGLGGAIARRFARGGHPTVLVARNADRLARIAAGIEAAGGRGIAYVADLREESAVAKLFDDVEAEIGPIDVAVFNTGANYRASILDTPADMFEKVWRLGCYAGFLVAQSGAKRMLARGSGAIFFTGASASVKGYAESAPFAMGKFALRGLAQSMARELAPKGLHIAHFVIDGGISRGAGDSRAGERGTDGMLLPDEIAKNYLHVFRQHRSAWTWEVELRPWVERF